MSERLLRADTAHGYSFMGQFHFRLPPDLTPAQAEAAGRGWLMNGYDHTPVPARRAAGADRFSLTRDDAESSFLAVAWPAAADTRTVTSATLRQTAEPYHLTVELARGAVNRLRTFVAELAAAGVDLPAELAAELAQVTRRFGRAMLGTGDSPADSAAAVLAAAGPVADQLAALLTDRRYRARTAAGPLDTRFGCRLSRPLAPADADAYAAAFNAVRIVPDWAAIEPYEAGFDWSTIDPLVRWATDAGLAVSIGPIIDVADGSFPDWVRSWQGDVPTLTAFLSDFVATVVARYRQQCRTWHLLGGFNHAPALGLSEDDRVKLAARLLDTAREVDPDGDWLLALAQPWGDYLARPGHAYSPFVLVDTLLRAGFDLGGLELEVLSGPADRCGAPRDALDVVQVIESYDALTVPLELNLGRPLPDAAAVGIADACLAAPTVRAVTWDSFTPADPVGRVPGSALLSSPDTLARFAHLRKSRLK